MVHPVTGATLFIPGKSDTLNFELDAYKLIEAYSARYHIAAKHLRSSVPDAELQAESLIGFFFEECDVPLPTVPVIKKSVSDDPLPGHAMNLICFGHWIFAGCTTVMLEVIVPGGNKQMPNLEFDAGHTQT